MRRAPIARRRCRAWPRSASTIERVPPAPGLDGPSLALIGRGLRGLHAPAAVARRGEFRYDAAAALRDPGGSPLHGHPDRRRIAAQAADAPCHRAAEPDGRTDSSRTHGRAPLTITGGVLRPIDYTPPVPSAQVKSAVLLAGLQTDGTTTVREAVTTRDHTEHGLPRVRGRGRAASTGGVSIEGGQRLRGIEATVPGDVSSATFWAVAAACPARLGRRARRTSA